MRIRARLLPMSAVALTLGLALAPAQTPSASQPKGIEKIEHIVVVYLENHSFDDLFGRFPGEEIIEAVVLEVNHDDVLDLLYAFGLRRRRRLCRGQRETERQRDRGHRQ